MIDAQGIIIAGPTASGKSQCALDLAKAWDGEIVNCDSTLVYRDFDIGTAKPTLEERAEVPHHLIDILSWDESFDAGIFANLAKNTIGEILGRKKVPIIVGGTGLYLRALLEDQWNNLPSDANLRKSLLNLPLEDIYAQLQARDPERASQLHMNDRFRIERALEIATLTGKTFKSLQALQQHSQVSGKKFKLIYFDPNPDELRVDIIKRIDFMFSRGIIEETQKNILNGCDLNSKIMQTIGYKQIALFLQGVLNLEETKEKIHFATAQYAKRQRTWFNKVKKQVHIMNRYQHEQHFSMLHHMRKSS